MLNSLYWRQQTCCQNASLLGFRSGQACFRRWLWFPIVWCYRSLLCWLLTSSCFCPWNLMFLHLSSLASYNQYPVIFTILISVTTIILTVTVCISITDKQCALVQNHMFWNQTALNLNSFLSWWITCPLRCPFLPWLSKSDSDTHITVFRRNWDKALLGGTLQACKPWSVPSLQPKKEPGDSDRDIDGLLDGELTCLKQGPRVSITCIRRRAGMAAVATTPTIYRGNWCQVGSSITIAPAAGAGASTKAVTNWAP